MAGNISRSNDLGIGNGIGVKLITLLSIIFLVSPLIILIAFSFNAGRTVTHWEGFSLYWYGEIFKDTNIWISIRNSFVIAFVSALFSTILGTMAALAVGKYAFKGREIFQNILYIPDILPEIIFGISLLALFLLIKLPLGFISIICAHITFSLSFVTLIVLAKLANFDPRLEEASLDLGANRWQTFSLVTFPNLMPAIVSGALFAFTLSIDDFIVTFFTAGISSSTLPLKIYSLIKFGVTPALNAVSTVLIIFTIVVLAITNALQNSPKINKKVKIALLSLAGVVILFFTISWIVRPEIKRLNIYNYSSYLSEDLINDFEKEYGIDISLDYFNDNEELLSRLQMGVTGYDLIVPTGQMVEILKKNGLLEQIDTTLMTNLHYVDPRFRRLKYDTTGTWYIPYAYGFSAIVYNQDLIKDTIDSWKDLWNEKYNSNILMLDDMYEVFFAGYRYLGYEMDKDPAKLQKVTELLIKQKPLILKYENVMQMDYMINGDVWIAQWWNGGISKILSAGKQYKMVIPEEGVLFFTDNLCIPKNAPNKASAELFINYILEPRNTARNIETILYAMPNEAAKVFLPDSIKNNPAIFPEESALNKMYIIEDQVEFATKFEEAWTRIKVK
jgi:spermidine/putrescine transport system permease protein